MGKRSRGAKHAPPAAPKPERWTERAQGPGDLECAFAIREIAFIEEQSVAPEVERDAADTSAVHVLAYEHGHAVGTGRLVVLEGDALVGLAVGETETSGRWGRIGRVAVMGSSRRRGIGGLIVAALEDEARRLGLEGLVVHAQTWLRELFVRQGYSVRGGEFQEAGMPHLEMVKHLTGSTGSEEGAPREPARENGGAEAER